MIAFRTSKYPRYTCVHCGKLFTGRWIRAYPERACCSAECRREYAHPQAVCKTCGKVFRYNRHGGRNDRPKEFCSRTCYDNQPTRPLVQAVCNWCGKQFQRVQLGRKGQTSFFCSQGCYRKARNAVNHGAEDGIVRCVVCGQSVQRGKRGHYHKTCGSLRCIAVRREEWEDKQEWGRLKKEHGEQWYRTIRNALDRCKVRTSLRRRWSDPWQRRLSSLASSERMRQKDVQKRRTAKSVPTEQYHCVTWRYSFYKALTNYSSRCARQKKKIQNPWYRRFESMAHNWRRRESGERTERTDGCDSCDIV